jgi:hypothetical protein
MNGVLLVVVIALLVVIATIQIFLLVRKVNIDLNPLQQALRSVEQSDERTERSVREEIAKNREETAQALRQSREELAGALKGVGDTLYGQVGLLTQTTDKKLDMLREAVEQRLQAIQADNAGEAAGRVLQTGQRTAGAGIQGIGRDAIPGGRRRRSEEGADEREDARHMG